MDRMRAGHELTNHAQGRCQQRGIKGGIFDLMVQEADREVPIGSGRCALSLSRRRVRELRERGFAAALLDRLDGLVLVVSPCGTVVTVLFASHRRYRRGIS